MNFLKKGPQIKMPSKRPEVKMPGFLQDIYYELDERHLLPLVVVLIVAIIALPIALSESADTSGPAAASAEAAATVSAASPSSAIVVSKSLPGLRDYRQRLKGLKSKDPFKQQFADAENTGESVEEGSVGGEESTGTETGGEESGGSSSGPESGTGQIKYYSWTIDTRVVPVSANGKPSKADPYVLKDQPELSMIPGRKTPALVFIGPSKDQHKAMMLVSSNVTGLFGDAVCVLGGETCEMVALEQGVPETFVYGGNQRVFRVELQKIKLTETDSLNRAKLGNPGNDKRPAEREAALVGAAAQPK